MCCLFLFLLLLFIVVLSSILLFPWSIFGDVEGIGDVKWMEKRIEMK